MPEREIHFDHVELESYLLHRLQAPDEILLEDHVKQCETCANRMKTVADWLVALRAVIHNNASLPGVSIPVNVNALTESWAVESVQQAVRRPQSRLMRAATAGALAGVGLFGVMVSSPFPKLGFLPEQELLSLARLPQAPALTLLPAAEDESGQAAAEPQAESPKPRQARMVLASATGRRQFFDVPIRSRRVSAGSVELPPPPQVRPVKAAMALPSEVRFAPPPRSGKFKRAVLGLWPFRAHREEPPAEPLRISYRAASRESGPTRN